MRLRIIYYYGEPTGQVYSKKKGWESSIDKGIFELGRIFRVPLSYNYKPTPARRVDFITLQDTFLDIFTPTRYDVQDLIHFAFRKNEVWDNTKIEPVLKKHKDLLADEEMSSKVVQKSLEALRQCKPTTELNDYTEYLSFIMSAKSAKLEYKDISEILERHQDKYKPEELHKKNEKDYELLDPKTITPATLVYKARLIAKDLWTKKINTIPKSNKKDAQLSYEQLLKKYSSFLDSFFIVPSLNAECVFRSKDNSAFELNLNGQAGSISFSSATQIPYDDENLNRINHLVRANQFKSVNGFINVYKEDQIHFGGYWKEDSFKYEINKQVGIIYDPITPTNSNDDCIKRLGDTVAVSTQRMLSFMIANRLVLRNRSNPKIKYEPLFFIMQDSGNTGKTNLMQAICLFRNPTDEMTYSSQDFTWENTWNLKQASDSLGLNWADEPEEINYDYVKALTGNPSGIYPAKMKHRATPVIIRACNIFITSNKLHLADVSDDGIRRRLVNAKTSSDLFMESKKQGPSMLIIDKYFDELRWELIKKNRIICQRIFKQRSSSISLQRH